jgi:hypothetical protein
MGTHLIELFGFLEVHSSHAAHSSVTHWGWWSFFWLIGDNCFCG